MFVANGTQTEWKFCCQWYTNWENCVAKRTQKEQHFCPRWYIDKVIFLSPVVHRHGDIFNANFTQARWHFFRQWFTNKAIFLSPMVHRENDKFVVFALAQSISPLAVCWPIHCLYIETSVGVPLPALLRDCCGDLVWFGLVWFGLVRFYGISIIVGF